MKTSFIAAGLAAAIVGALCMVAHASPPEMPASASSATPAKQERKVSISNFTFSPATLEVPAGTTLRWVNDDDVPHTVLGSDKGSVIRSPALDTNDGYALVLREPGTYHYFCSLHPHMTGTIVVK
jgi:plastocyanin